MQLLRVLTPFDWTFLEDMPLSDGNRSPFSVPQFDIRLFDSIPFDPAWGVRILNPGPVETMDT